MGITDHKLKFVIDADGKAARRELVDIDNMIGRMGAGLGSLAGPAAIGATAIAGIGAASIAGGVALFNLTKQASDYGSAIFDASKKTGLGAEALSAMDFAAKQSGTSLEQITGGVAKFAKTVGEAADGSDKAAKKLKDFGIVPQEAINDLDGALGKVFQRIIDAPPGIERMTLAQKAFGKSGADLLPFIDSFHGDLGGLIKRAKELGVTIDDEAARASDEFGDQLDTLSSQLAATGRAIGFAFMKPFNEMAQDVSAWLAVNKGEVSAWANSVISAFGLVAAGASNLKTNLDTLDDFLVTFFSGGTWQDYYDKQAGRAESRMFSNEQLGFEREKARFERETDRYKSEMKRLKRTASYGSNDEDAAGGKKRSSASGDSRTDKQVYQDFVKELKNLGVTINSGYRTFAQQAALFAKLPAGQAARPGTSDHEFYRAVDLPPGVSQETLQRAALAAGVTLSKPNVHQGTGLHNHQAFKKGMPDGGGEDEIAREREQTISDARDLERQINEALRDAAAEMISEEKEASQNRLEIRQNEAEQTVAIIEGMIERGEITEIDSIRTLGKLKLDALKDEQSELAAQIPTKENLHRLDLLRLKIGTQSIKNTNAELGYWKQITDEIKQQLDALQKKNQRPTALGHRESYEDRIARMARTTIGSGQEISAIGQLQDYFVSEGNEAAIAGVDAMTQALGGMGQALGSVVQAWVLYGSAGQSAQQMTAQVLAGIAQQATVKAVFELAEGFAMLALAFFGHPGAGPSATQHFIAAGIYAGIAGGAALAGRAIAGNSFSKQGGSKGGSSGTGSNSGRSQNDNLQPISRASEDTYISGRRGEARAVAMAIDKLTKKIDGMRPGDVLVAGARQKKGFVANQFSEDVKSNSALGSKAARSIGLR